MMNSQTLEHFLGSIRAPALKYAQLQVSDVDIALDMLQEAMMDFVKVSDDYPEAAWKGVLYKILLRRIRDYQRKQYWRGAIARFIPMSQLSSDQGGEQDVISRFAAAETADQTYIHQQLGTHFERALAALPERQRQAYLLRQWQELGVRETAIAMQCSEGSVKTHLSRAMKNLKQALGEWLDE